MKFRDCRDICMVSQKLYENSEVEYEADLHLLYIISDSYALFDSAVRIAFNVYPLMFYPEFDSTLEELDTMKQLHEKISAMAEADEKPDTNDTFISEFLNLLKKVYSAFANNGYNITNNGDFYSVENENRRVFSPEDAREYKEALALISED